MTRKEIVEFAEKELSRLFNPNLPLSVEVIDGIGYSVLIRILYDGDGVLGVAFITPEMETKESCRHIIFDMLIDEVLAQLVYWRYKD